MFWETTNMPTISLSLKPLFFTVGFGAPDFNVSRQHPVQCGKESNCTEYSLDVGEVAKVAAFFSLLHFTVTNGVPTSSQSGFTPDPRNMKHYFLRETTKRRPSQHPITFPFSNILAANMSNYPDYPNHIPTSKGRHLVYNTQKRTT